MYKEKFKKKKQWNCRWEKISKAIEENKFTVTIKILLWEFNLYYKLMYTAENNDKSKTQQTPPSDFEIFRFPVCFY